VVPKNTLEVRMKDSRETEPWENVKCGINHRLKLG